MKIDGNMLLKFDVMNGYVFIQEAYMEVDEKWKLTTFPILSFNIHFLNRAMTKHFLVQEKFMVGKFRNYLVSL